MKVPCGFNASPTRSPSRYHGNIFPCRWVFSGVEIERKVSPFVCWIRISWISIIQQFSPDSSLETENIISKQKLNILPALLLSLCRVCVGLFFRNPKKSFVWEFGEVEWKEHGGYSWLSVAGWNAPYKVAQSRSLDGIEEILKNEKTPEKLKSHQSAIASENKFNL